MSQKFWGRWGPASWHEGVAESWKHITPPNVLSTCRTKLRRSRSNHGRGHDAPPPWGGGVADPLEIRFSATCVAMPKVKVHTLDIAPLRSETPPQKRSDMACVLKGFHSFTCTPTRSFAIGMSHTCLCLSSRSWYSFRPRRDGRLSRPWCEVAQTEIRTCNLPIANPALYHTATSASCHIYQQLPSTEGQY